MIKTPEEVIKEGVEGYPLRDVIDNLTNEQLLECFDEYANQFVGKTLLWLDDLRNPFLNVEGKVPEGNYKIVWVLNYDEFTEWISRFGLPDIISFDHDLAFEHYTPEEYWSDYEKSKEYQDKQAYTEKTGFDCAKWLVDYCIDNSKSLPKFYAHSANPVGADNIMGILNNYNKFKINE